MPAFSITPVTDFPAAADDGFPRYIQWRYNGVDLGGPDATVVDFVGSFFTVERTTVSEGVDKITITAG